LDAAKLYCFCQKASGGFSNVHMVPSSRPVSVARSAVRVADAGGCSRVDVVAGVVG
jgi:hypothetical protein